MVNKIKEFSNVVLVELENGLFELVENRYDEIKESNKYHSAESVLKLISEKTNVSLVYKNGSVINNFNLSNPNTMKDYLVEHVYKGKYHEPSGMYHATTLENVIASLKEEYDSEGRVEELGNGVYKFISERNLPSYLMFSEYLG